MLVSLLMDEITLVVLGDPAEPVLRTLDSMEGGIQVRIGKTAAALGDAVGRARVLFSWAGSKDEVRKVMEGAPNLEWIHVRHAGLDRFLFPELIESAIPLTNGSGVFSQSLGEFAILGALYFAKDVPRILKAKSARRWDVFDVAAVRTQTMGIVGYGDIGRAVARRAKALDMRVVALRRNPAPRAGDEYVDQLYATKNLHAMLAECDYVVVAAPLTPETAGMIGKSEFERMKPDAIIMNIGRGPVIDESAMVDALRQKQIRGAWLDVFDVEPLPPDHPLWSMDNVFISAHCADHTKDWLQDAVDFFVDQFERWRKGEPLKNIVDKRAGY
jgi:phosphoglycerate dehydrogenase-like enzyme